MSRLMLLLLALTSLSCCASPRTVYVEAPSAVVAEQKAAQQKATREALSEDETFQRMIRDIRRK